MRYDIVKELGQWLWDLSGSVYLPEWIEDYTPEDEENAKMSGQIIAGCEKITNVLRGV